MILQMLADIKQNYPPLKLRIEIFEDDLQENLTVLLNKVFDPYKIRKLLK